MMRRCTLLLFSLLLAGPLVAQVETEGKIALIFSGGGGKGAYEIGVWKALSELDIEIGGVYGASVGSINGAALVMGDFETVRDVWLDTDYLSVMNLSQPAKTLLSGDFHLLVLHDYLAILQDFHESGGIDVSPLKGLLMRVLSEEKIRSSMIDYGFVILSVSGLEPQDLYIEQIPEGELIDYILASANFPLFKRQEIDGQIFIDGGVYSNRPVQMAIRRGFRDIIVVEIGFSSPVDTVNYLSTVGDASIHVTRIKPREQYGTVLTFEREVSRKYLLEGYLDTMKSFGRLGGKRYYIYGSDDPLKEMFDGLDRDERAEALSIIGVADREFPDGADLFEERVVPIFELALLDVLPDEQRDVNLNLLETLAHGTGVEPLAVYSRRDLLEEVLITADEGSYNTDLAEEVMMLWYGKILTFLRYLYEHSSKNPPVPEGYAVFKEGFSTLLK